MLLFTPALHLARACSYRHPMLVRERMVFLLQKDSYPLCPRCQITLDREFMHYCDRCGQCLDWSRYDWARVIYPGQAKRGIRAKSSDPTV